jgi:hypothetical protein
MTKKRHREKQAITVLKDAQVGIVDLRALSQARNSDATFLWGWRSMLSLQSVLGKSSASWKTKTGN